MMKEKLVLYKEHQQLRKFTVIPNKYLIIHLYKTQNSTARTPPVFLQAMFI